MIDHNDLVNQLTKVRFMQRNYLFQHGWEYLPIQTFWLWQKVVDGVKIAVDEHVALEIERVLVLKAERLAKGEPVKEPMQHESP